MTHRTKIRQACKALAVLAVFSALLAGPASARDDRHVDRHVDRHWDAHRHGWVDGYYGAPPVVYAAPYCAPPVIVTPGITIAAGCR